MFNFTMNKTCQTICLATAITMSSFSANASERDYISVVGSSTVYPFATVVAETFGKTTSFKTPKVESTGSGGGFKLFCTGLGVSYPDITNSSRRIKQSEIDDCLANGVVDIIEVKVGYDGIVIANSNEAILFDLTTKELFQALAKDLPNDQGEFVPNFYQTWQEINESLPATKIEVLGPPPTSGTRDAFVELAMESGCESFDAINALEKDIKKARCHSIREDGAYVETGENDNLIVQKLEANKDALGIFGFSFLDQNSDKVKGSSIGGVAPEFEAISDGSYPISRPLYFYVKAAHIGIVPGIEEFLLEYSEEGTWGEEGYLVDKGLIPMQQEERDHFLENIQSKRFIKSLN